MPNSEKTPRIKDFLKNGELAGQEKFRPLYNIFPSQKSYAIISLMGFMRQAKPFRQVWTDGF